MRRQGSALTNHAMEGSFCRSAPLGWVMAEGFLLLGRHYLMIINTSAGVSLVISFRHNANSIKGSFACIAVERSANERIGSLSRPTDAAPTEIPFAFGTSSSGQI